MTRLSSIKTTGIPPKLIVKNLKEKFQKIFVTSIIKKILYRREGFHVIVGAKLSLQLLKFNQVQQNQKQQKNNIIIPQQQNLNILKQFHRHHHHFYQEQTHSLKQRQEQQEQKQQYKHQKCEIKQYQQQHQQQQHYNQLKQQSSLWLTINSNHHRQKI